MHAKFTKFNNIFTLFKILNEKHNIKEYIEYILVISDIYHCKKIFYIYNFHTINKFFILFLILEIQKYI